MCPLRSSAEILAANDYWKESDWDSAKAVLDGFTPSGTFVSPYTYVIAKNTDGGVDYYSASNAFQTIYGGSTTANHHIGGVDGADATAVINAAITTANAAGGGIVFLKNGTYTVSGRTPIVGGILGAYGIIRMKSYVHLIGESMFGVVLKGADNVSANVIAGELTTTFTEIANLSVDGNKTNQTCDDIDGHQCGIIMFSTHSTMHDLCVHDTVLDGVYDSGWENNYDHHIYVYNTGGAYTNSYGGFNFSTPSRSVADHIYAVNCQQGITVDNTVFSTATNLHAVSCISNGIIITSTCTDCSFDNLHSSNCAGYGLLLQGAKRCHYGSIFSDHDGLQGVNITSDDSSIDYISVTSAGRTTPSEGIFISTVSCHSLKIGYTLIRDLEASPTMTYGILVYPVHALENISINGGNVSECNASTADIEANGAALVSNVYGFLSGAGSQILEKFGVANGIDADDFAHGLGVTPHYVFITPRINSGGGGGFWGKAVSLAWDQTNSDATNFRLSAWYGDGTRITDHTVYFVWHAVFDLTL